MRSNARILLTITVMVGIALGVVQAQPPTTSVHSTWAGIGAVISVRSIPGTDVNGLFIASVIPMGPAANAGIKAGDQILAVDGVPTKGHSLAEVVELIRGKQGTEVNIAVKRTGIEKPLEFAIARQPVIEPQPQFDQSIRPKMAPRPTIHEPIRDMEWRPFAASSSQSSMLLQGEMLFILHGGILYKFNADTMQQLQAVPLTPPPPATMQ